MNIGFLVVGIILSTLSKWLQVQGNDELGDLLVFPAAFFLGLALVTSFPFFKDWWREPSSRPRALRFASLVAAGILSFQLFAWLVFGQGEWLGALFLLPFFICVYFIVRTFK